MQIDKKLTEKENWYILQTYSGHENKVANQIMQRAKANDIVDEVVEVKVPTQEKILVSEGKKRKKEERLFPGYVLINMKLTEKSWQVVRNTEGVTGFVGTNKQPTPLTAKEVKSILAFTKVEQPAYSASFTLGQAVKVSDGPFKDFVGSISEINEDKGQVKVLLSIFGRETPVVLDFLQVSKL